MLVLLTSCLTIEVPETVEETQTTQNTDSNTSISGSLLEENFDNNSSDWNLYAGEKFGCAADLSYSNGEAVVNITSAGAEKYGIQFRKDGVHLEGGSEYVIKFSARANKERTIELNFCMSDAPYTAYSDATEVALTTEMTDYEIEFMMFESTDNNSRFRFRLGKTGEGPVYIDNVKLEKL